jgi:alpha-N-arabinofuranosidase
VEIGNEDYFQKANTYDARFTQFYDAIKAKYPQLKCISTTPPKEGMDKIVKSRKPEVLDEHYYAPADEFLKMAAGKYENYDRKGVEIFVGEWACFETPFPPWNEKSRGEAPTPNLRAAIGDAAFMTQMEKNSDVIVMHCYAPMLVNVNPGGRQWRPNLIGYDALRAFGSPSYYAIQMFGSNVGDEIVKVSGMPTNVFASATRHQATGVVYLKLVNANAQPQALHLDFAGATIRDASALTLAAASSEATNSLGTSDAVTPKLTPSIDLRSGASYTLPANAVVVLTLRTK